MPDKWKEWICDFLFQQQEEYMYYHLRNVWGFGDKMRDYLLEGAPQDASELVNFGTQILAQICVICTNICVKMRTAGGWYGRKQAKNAFSAQIFVFLHKSEKRWKP